MDSTKPTQPRIAPLEPPYEPEIEASLQRWMGKRDAGIPPLNIFRTMHRNRQLADAITSPGRYILSNGKLKRHQREILILRTCARCGAEYEWGVHAAVYPPKVGLSPKQVALTATLAPGESSLEFEGSDAWVLAAADELHDDSFISDRTWAGLSEYLDDEQLLELLLVCGWYHWISYLARSGRIPFEPWQARFPQGATIQGQ